MSTGRLYRAEMTHPANTGRLYRAEMTSVLPSNAGRLYRAQMDAVQTSVTGRLFRAQMEAPVALVASAGNPQVDLEPWTLVALAGTESGGVSTTKRWRQVSGPAVTLASPTTSRTSYEAPGTLAGGTVVFGYVVTGGNGIPSTEATVAHTVLPVTERAVVGGVEVPLKITTAS